MEASAEESKTTTKPVSEKAKVTLKTRVQSLFAFHDVHERLGIAMIACRCVAISWHG